MVPACMRLVSMLCLTVLATPALAELPWHELTNDAEAPPATLTGVVRAMGTKEPLAGARLTVPGAGLELETDVDGRFTATLPTGSWAVEVSHTGFGGRTFSEVLVSGQRLEVLYRLARVQVEGWETVVRARRTLEDARVELSRTELTEAAGTQGDPFRVAMLLPGVASIASGLSYPVVRGTQPAATGFFLDGVKLPQLYHLLAGPSVVHEGFIDRVDFFSGAVPTRFGRLLGGVIEGRVARAPTRLKAIVSVDLLSASAFVSTPIEPLRLEVSLAGRFSYTALIATQVASLAFPSTPEAPQPKPVANFQDYQARIEWSPGPGKLRLFALGAVDEAGVRENGPGTATTVLSSVFHRVDLVWRMPLGPGQGEVGATWGTEQLGLVGSREGRDVGTLLTRRSVLQARARWTGTIFERLSLDTGLDVDRQDVSLTAERAPTIAVGAATSLREPRTVGTLAGVFLEGGLTFREWTVTLGLRGDAFLLDGGPSRFSVEPRLTVKRPLTPWLGMRAAAGLAHQSPTVLINLPISDLAALRDGLQSGARFEVGADATLPFSLEASTSLFYNPLFSAIESSLEDLFTNRARLGQAQASGVPGRAYGVELLLRRRAQGRWFGWVSYTFLRAERLKQALQFDASGAVSDEGLRWLPFDFDQSHVLHVTGGVLLPLGFKVSAGLHVNTGRPESGVVSSRAQRPDVDPVTLQRTWVPVSLAQEPRLPAFARLDVRASKTWTFDDFVLEAYLDVLNATATAEVLGYTYDSLVAASGQRTLKRAPFAIPLVLPTLGLKGSY